MTSEVRIVPRTEEDLLASVAERFRPAVSVSPLACCVPVSPQGDERRETRTNAGRRASEGYEQEQDGEEWFRSHMLECVEMERRHRLEWDAEKRRLRQERDDRKRLPRVQRLASYTREVSHLAERTRMNRRHKQELAELYRF